MSEPPTVAFEPAALRRLADPAGAVADARSWAAHVGVAAETPDRAATAASQMGVTPEYVASVDGESDGLAVVKRQYPADRYVFVGTTDADRRAARSLDWEYLDAETAAARAGWRLAEADDRWRAGADPDR